MTCRLCGAEQRVDAGDGHSLEVGLLYCAMCGRVIERLPPGNQRIAFNLTVEAVLGWPEEKVLETFGPPEQKAVGRVWTTEPGTPEYPGPVTVGRTGRVERAGRRFGPRLPKIAFPQAYEEWSYRMFRGGWILCVTGTDRSQNQVVVTVEPPDDTPPGVWEALQGLFGESVEQKRRRRHEDAARSRYDEAFKPKGPLYVADAYSAPDGVIY
jgi:hypothetical protein